MAKELVISAKSVEEAVELAAEQTGIKKEELKYEVVAESKKGLFGIGAQDAKISVTIEETPDELAVNFVKTVLRDLELSTDNVELVETSAKEATIVVTGDDMGLVIGHHGEILESLQYLTNLAANKGIDGYRRYVVDVENYRAKREETLRKLAQKTAARAKRQGRNIVLEPMSAYERRTIHSEVQDIEGVTTFSIGSGDQRKVVVSPENQRAPKPKTQKKDAPRKAEPEKKPLDPDIPLTYAGGGVSKQPIVKAKSIEELGLADPDESDIY
ncbi:MAG: protein jag [Clostridia bacterium]|nr:protein jag [Clostridia bacterium]